MSEVYFDEISPIKGIYSDYVYLKDHILVSIIRVKGINVDSLPEQQQNILFDEYGAYLTQNVHYYPQNVSMTVPIKISDYLMKWKKKYLKSINDANCSEDLKQLRASYLCQYQNAEISLDMARKEHFVVIREKLKKPTLEYLQESEKRLSLKVEEVFRAIHQLMEQYDGEQEILNAYEAASVLHQFLDYRSSVYS